MLRDMFASIGWCESTQQIEAKPRLVLQMLHLARPYSKQQARKFHEELSEYEGRLSATLEKANYKQLNHMINCNVIPVLDRRISEAKHGFWSKEIYATLHRKQGQHILGLFDRGELKSGFWERGNLDYPEKVFEAVSGIDFKIAGDVDILLGRLTYANKVMSFRWQTPDQMNYEVKRNPWMIQSPVDFINGVAPQPKQPKP